MPTTVFPGSYDSLQPIAALIRQAAQEIGFDDCETYKIETSVDEACSNIIEHAYGGEDRGQIELTYEIEPDRLIIILRDNGQVFNPKKVARPNTKAPLSKRAAHGLGLFIMQKWMDEVEFSIQGGMNQVTMVKKLEQA
mgnify:CR=1 FL=1